MCFHFNASTHVKVGLCDRDLTIMVIISLKAGNQTAKNDCILRLHDAIIH